METFGAAVAAAKTLLKTPHAPPCFFGLHLCNRRLCYTHYQSPKHPQNQRRISVAHTAAILVQRHIERHVQDFASGFPGRLPHQRQQLATPCAIRIRGQQCISLDAPSLFGYSQCGHVIQRLRRAGIDHYHTTGQRLLRLCPAAATATPDSAADVTFDNYGAWDVTVPPQLQIDRAVVLSWLVTRIDYEVSWNSKASCIQLVEVDCACL